MNTFCKRNFVFVYFPWGAILSLRIQNSFMQYFVHPIFCFFHYWQRSYENTKILRNRCLRFVRQDGQENQATKVTKIPKPKDENMEWTKHKSCLFANFATQLACWSFVIKISCLNNLALKPTVLISYLPFYWARL